MAPAQPATCPLQNFSPGAYRLRTVILFMPSLWFSRLFDHREHRLHRGERTEANEMRGAITIPRAGQNPSFYFLAASVIPSGIRSGIRLWGAPAPGTSPIALRMNPGVTTAVSTARF